MPASRQLQFVHGQLAWMLGTILLLTVLGSFTLELFVICTVIGVLVLTELTAPVNVAPRWRSRLIWVVAVAVLAFAAFVGHRLIEILPPEVLPW